MSDKIRVGIAGYGNLGKGVLAAVKNAPDMELIAVFTRRNPESIPTEDSSVKILSIDEAPQYEEAIDVMILCGGSASDLPKQGPQLVKLFNTVDSFDTHARIPEYFNQMDLNAKENRKVGIISVGWDPGLFSMNRLLMEAVLPQGKDYTFWGKGVSQGHSDAIRRVEGVSYGIQYTIPRREALDKVRQGLNPSLSARDKHLRDCYVVAEEGADKAKIEKAIKTMPNYFADYDTTVTFITKEDMEKNHVAMPHGGFVIRSGATGTGENKDIIEFSLRLDSNPEFTGSVLAAYARAAWRLSQEGQIGAKTVFDIPLAYLSHRSPEQLRKELL